MMHRRGILRVGALAAATSLAAPALACSLVPTPRPLRFNDLKCRREIDLLLTLFNTPDFAAEVAGSWLGERNIQFGQELLDDVANRDETTLLRTFLVAEGKRDRVPVRAGGVDLIRQHANRAAFAMILRRHRYFAADEEGCNGMFVHDAYWADERTAYLATFINNRMVGFRHFPEWAFGDR